MICGYLCGRFLKESGIDNGKGSVNKLLSGKVDGKELGCTFAVL
jgi:hypothetical protein